MDAQTAASVLATQFLHTLEHHTFRQQSEAELVARAMQTATGREWGVLQWDRRDAWQVFPVLEG